MQRMKFGGAVAGMVMAAMAVAEGYYPGNDIDGPGSINWPPPGGSAARPSSQYGLPSNKGFRPYADYQQAQRYHDPMTHQFPRELIKPPGEDWPNADYYNAREQGAPGELRPKAEEEKGAPVEVVPPPSIPIDEVKAPLSEKPERGWRPMKKQEHLQAMEESRVPPPSPSTAPVMRKIEKRASPLQLIEMPKAVDDNDEQNLKPEK